MHGAVNQPGQGGDAESRHGRQRHQQQGREGHGPSRSAAADFRSHGGAQEDECHQVADVHED